MADAKLKFNDDEIVLGQGVTTLGRTTDNTVAFASDSNVSRYHAEIEWRDGDFWLIDLGSSNGTNLNGEAVKGDKRLNDGDEILLGGTSRAEFSVSEKKTEETSAATEREDSEISTGEGSEKKEEAEITQDAPTTPKSRMPLMLGIAGATVGLAVVCVVGAVIYSSYSGATGCEAKVVITKPDNQDTITEKTEIEVEVEAENAECVSRAIFLINGAEFADATEQPFTATLDPKQFPELADGNLQPLQIVLEDAEGNQILQPGEFFLALETIEIATPTPTPEDIAADPTPTPARGGQKASLIELQKMTEKLVGEFPGTFNYNASNPQFLQEVQKKTGEYAAEGFYARASAYKDVLSVAFVQERNLDARLAFILAMSRSQFKPQKNGAGEGLWQMNADFVENNYKGLCGTETLSDPAQNCASKIASLYLKALILEVFEGDVIYSVAAFGKSPQEANIWKATLPADRADFWNVIKDAKQREQVVRFFAAGIVAENPQQFGLKKDRPISELYKTLVGN